MYNYFIVNTDLLFLYNNIQFDILCTKGKLYICVCIYILKMPIQVRVDLYKLEYAMRSEREMELLQAMMALVY